MSENAPKTAWKVTVVDDTGNTKPWIVLMPKESRVADLTRAVEERENKRRRAQGSSRVSVGMEMKFGGDICEVDEEDVLQELIGDASKDDGFVATIKAVAAVARSSKVEDPRPAKKPRASKRVTQWETISANGGEEGMIGRAEKLILVAHEAAQASDLHQARDFARTLVRRTASGRSEQKAARMEINIGRKMMNMVDTDAHGIISVNRSKFRALFRTKVDRTGFDCVTRYLLGQHYVENEQGDNNSGAIDGDTTRRCIRCLVEATKEYGRTSGSLQYYSESEEELYFKLAL